MKPDTLTRQCDRCGWTAGEDVALSDEDMALHEDVMGELLACYGEGDDTDWPYLTDLAGLIVSLIHKHGTGGPT